MDRAVTAELAGDYLAGPIAHQAIRRNGQDQPRPRTQDGDLRAPLLPAGEPVDQLLRKGRIGVPY
jgi:hypothetical protein